jgi:acetyl esterase/lipase
LAPPQTARDTDAFFAELASWAERHDSGFTSIPYGPEVDQVADVRVPAAPAPHRTALVIHGGFWRARFTRRNTEPLAIALARAGWCTANVEYRRLGRGRFRELLADVEEAARTFRPQLAIGHSAGGHLALWLAARGLVPAVVALGGVCDLEAAARAGLGGDAVEEFLGTLTALDEADPARMLPLGVPQLFVHGRLDDRVPLQHAEEYALAARAAGDECSLLVLDDADHFDPIDPRYDGFARIVEAVPR